MACMYGPARLAPLVIGAVLIALVYAGFHISGAHYNPAVTISVYLRGRIGATEILPYIVAQVIGGILAAWVASYLIKSMEVPAITPLVLLTGPALLAEFLGTFALCFVILNVATVKSTDGNGYYGLAIGLTVMAGAYVFGGVSGGVFNPAVAIGISTAGMTRFADIWIYFAGTLTGGVIAAYVFRLVYGPGG